MKSGIYWMINQQYAFADKNKLSDVGFMDRAIEKFSCSTNDQYRIEGAMGMPLPPFVASFSTDLLQGNMLGVADEDGHVKLIDTSKSKNSSILKEWSAHSNAIFDLAWIEKESKMVTASGDQTARLWDVEKCSTIGNFRGHTCSLKSIAVQPRSSRIFMTGARDGNIMLWDTRCNLRNGYHTPINTIHRAHERVQVDGSNSVVKKRRGRRASCQTDLKQSVTAAVFLDDCRIISSGACDGALKYWDIRKNYSNIKGEAVPHHVINFSGKGPRKVHGFTSLVLNSSSSRLFSVCTNNIIYEFPTTNLASQPLATYQGHVSSSFYVKAALSPDDRYLLCGSTDNCAYIWRTDQANSKPWVLVGHAGEVTSVAWSPNCGDKVVTCSDDNTFKIWRLFQDNSDPSASSGSVKRKCTPQELTSADNIQEEALLQESVIPDIPEKNEKCFCRSLNMCTNGNVRVRWSIGTVKNAKDTISKTNLHSRAWNSSSPYTVVTPKSTKLPTPSRSLRDKLTSSPSNSPALSQHASRNTASPIAKTSRLFMESWLKSPGTPGKMSSLESKWCNQESDNTEAMLTVGSSKEAIPLLEITKVGSSKEANPLLEITKVGSSKEANPSIEITKVGSSKEANPLLDITKVDGQEVKEGNKVHGHSDGSHTQSSRNHTQSRTNSNHRRPGNDSVKPFSSIRKNVLNNHNISPTTSKSKKQSPVRSKKGVNHSRYGDIKLMILNQPIKRKSESIEEGDTGKKSRSEKENLPTVSIENLPIDSTKLKSHEKEKSEMCIAAATCEVERPVTHKENIPNDAIAVGAKGVVKAETVGVTAEEHVLKEITVPQNEVKDILDIAEDSKDILDIAEHCSSLYC